MKPSATTWCSRVEIPVTIFKQGDCINVGPFEIEAIGVNHSIPRSRCRW